MRGETIILGRKHFVGGITAVAFETNIKNWRKIRAKYPTYSMEYRKATQHINNLNRMLHEFERKYPTEKEKKQ